MNLVLVIDILCPWLLFFNQPGDIYRKVVTKILFGNLFRDHYESKECQTWTSGDVLNKVVPNVNDELICCEDFSNNRILFHRRLNFPVDLMQCLDLVLKLLAFFRFLCLGQFVYQFDSFLSMVIQLRRWWLWYWFFHPFYWMLWYFCSNFHLEIIKIW